MVCIRQKKTAGRSPGGLCKVGVTGFEPTASWSRTKRATICATPREKNRSNFAAAVLVVGDERIELPRAESESAALPLCESPVGCLGFLSGCPLGCLPSTFIYYSGSLSVCQQFFSKKFHSFSRGKTPVFLAYQKEQKSMLHQNFFVHNKCRGIDKEGFCGVLFT